MNKFKQCTYTVILLVTCIVASPFIFKQIWDSSSEKKKTEKLPPIAITGLAQQAQATTVPTDQPEQTTVADPNAVTTTTVAGADALSTTTTTTTTEAPTEPQAAFVQGDASYFDDALFIGDSRMVGIRDYGTLSNATYFCNVGLASYKIDSEYIDGNSFAGILQAKQYGKVYIMLGINEVGNSFEYTVNAYSSMINTIKQYQPNATIVILANLHVTAGAQTESISNERINYLNGSIAQFADNKTVFYLDINPVFDDADGNLRSDATGDGVHVYANYYPTWCEWLCMNTVKR